MFFASFKEILINATGNSSRSLPIDQSTRTATWPNAQSPIPCPACLPCASILPYAIASTSNHTVDQLNRRYRFNYGPRDGEYCTRRKDISGSPPWTSFCFSLVAVSELPERIQPLLSCLRRSADCTVLHFTGPSPTQFGKSHKSEHVDDTGAKGFEILCGESDDRLYTDKPITSTRTSSSG